MEKIICIIDDDPIYRLIVRRIVKSSFPDITCHECDGGEIGLTFLKSNQDSGNQIIVFLDINMPGMDGWKVLDKLKESIFYGIPALSVYMVSSSTDNSDKDRCKEYDFVNGFFHKPLSVGDLNKALG